MVAIVSCIVEGKLDKPLSYKNDAQLPLKIGDLIQVSLRNKPAYAVVIGYEESSHYKLKIVQCKTKYAYAQSFIDFLVKAAHHSIEPIGLVFKSTLFVPDSEKQCVPSTDYPDSEHIKLSHDQLACYDQIIANFKTLKPTILHGVTGSGKSEVFLKCAAHVLKNKQSVLLLMPEIALTQQMVDRITSIFGERPDVWHSTVSAAKKKRIWHNVQSGNTCFVIGARSALFLPFKNLGLIIVDEEHDTSYKQEESPIYHARDLAVLRANITKIPVILASATPSMESLYNVEKQKYTYIPLTTRYGGATMPQLSLIDMRLPREKSPYGWISQTLIAHIKHNLAHQEQTMIFLNRRGYSPLVFCKECGFRYECPDCAVCLVQHKNKGLICHHCGYHKPMPHTCEDCGGADTLISSGPGVEKIKDHIDAIFPHARTYIFSSDHLTTPNKLAKAYEEIRAHHYDIIIGTQMLAKGHHFPNVTLVGILDGDFGMVSTDFRSAEKGLQLCLQAAGRAGRDKKPGKVLIQTHTPESPIFKELQHSSGNTWHQEELKLRKKLHLAPFTRLIAIILSSKDAEVLKDTANTLAKHAPHSTHVDVLGPVDAPISPLRGMYRQRFLLRVHKQFRAHEFITHWLRAGAIPNKVKVKVDVDPYSFM